MSGHPPAAALILAVEAFLRELEGELTGRRAFHAKVAANALAIVARELEQLPAGAEAAALMRIVGHDAPVLELRSVICAGLRNGSLDYATPGLILALEQAALARLAVDNPRYSTFVRLTEGEHAASSGPGVRREPSST